MPRSRSLFEGVPAAELEQILASLDRRRYPAGSVVIAEGESSRELYIAQSGVADVYVADRAGTDHRVGRVTAGATLGEMSLLTGEPAASTVRAADDLDVLVLRPWDFEHLTTRFPIIYRNVGAILSERLARTNRLTLREEPGRLTVLRREDAPPLLGFALAASLAWHTREPVLLVRVDSEPPAELLSLATLSLESVRASPRTAASDGSIPARAHLVLAAPGEEFKGAALASTMETLTQIYRHVLLEVDAPPEVALPARTVVLGGADRRGEPESVTLSAWRKGSGRIGPDASGVLPVPPLASQEEAALREGLLPSNLDAGKALGWCARDLGGLKVGLALGAGAARGYAHFGVLAGLEEIGLPIDYLAGTSIGAAVAGLYSIGEHAVDEFDRIASAVFRLSLPPRRSFLSSTRIRKRVLAVGGDRRFDELPVPLAITAADLTTKREVIFTRGVVWPAVVASMAIPGIYPALRIGNYTLVDGGVLNPVPSNVPAEMGADTVVAVKLGAGGHESVADEETTLPTIGASSVVQTILTSIEIMQGKISATTAAPATVVISPPLDDGPPVGLRNFKQGRRYVESGARAVEEARVRLVAAFPWLRS